MSTGVWDMLHTFHIPMRHFALKIFTKCTYLAHFEKSYKIQNIQKVMTGQYIDFNMLSSRSEGRYSGKDGSLDRESTHMRQCYYVSITYISTFFAE